MRYTDANAAGALSARPSYSAEWGPVSTGPLFRGGGDDAAPTRRDFARFLFRHKWLVLGCALLVGALVGGGLYVFPATYETQARLLVKTEERAGPTFFGGSAAFRDAPVPRSTAAQLETEMQLLTALPLAREVVERVGVRPDQVYRSPLAFFSTPIVRAWAWFRIAVLGREPGVPDVQRELAEALQKSVAVAPVQSKTGEGVSNVIQVSLVAADPVMARDALEALLDGYLRARGSSDAAAGRTAERILEREVAEVERELMLAERALRDFVARQGPAGSPAPLTAARADAAVAERRSQLADLELRLFDARQKYTPDSPPVQSLLGEIAALRERIDRDVAAGAVADARFGELSRSVAAAEARHAELERRLVEARLFSAVMEEPLGDRVVVEPPLMPDGSDWKKRVVIGAIGAIAGLCLGLGLAGLTQLTDTRLRGKDDVVRRLGLPVLAVLPATARRNGRHATELAEASAARGLAARLVATLGDWPAPGPNGGRIVLVTSAHPHEGKSTVAALVADQLAVHGYGRVLLVRAGAASAARVRGAAAVAPAPVLAGVAAAGGAMGAASSTNGAGDVGTLAPPPPDVPGRPTILDFAGVDPAGATPPVGGALFSYLGEAAGRYDWTVVDGGSLGGGEVHAVAQRADAVLLVVHATSTRRAVVEDALRGVRFGRHTAVAVVLNRAAREIPSLLYERL